jgi:hypothetical protein
MSLKQCERINSSRAIVVPGTVHRKIRGPRRAFINGLYVFSSQTPTLTRSSKLFKKSSELSKEEYSKRVKQILGSDKKSSELTNNPFGPLDEMEVSRDSVNVEIRKTAALEEAARILDLSGDLAQRESVVLKISEASVLRSMRILAHAMLPLSIDESNLAATHQFNYSKLEFLYHVHVCNVAAAVDSALRLLEELGTVVDVYAVVAKHLDDQPLQRRLETVRPKIESAIASIRSTKQTTSEANTSMQHRKDISELVQALRSPDQLGPFLPTNPRDGKLRRLLNEPTKLDTNIGYQFNLGLGRFTDASIGWHTVFTESVVPPDDYEDRNIEFDLVQDFLLNAEALYLVGLIEHYSTLSEKTDETIKSLGNKETSEDVKTTDARVRLDTFKGTLTGLGFDELKKMLNAATTLQVNLEQILEAAVKLWMNPIENFEDEYKQLNSALRPFDSAKEEIQNFFNLFICSHAQNQAEVLWKFIATKGYGFDENKPEFTGETLVRMKNDSDQGIKAFTRYLKAKSKAHQLLLSAAKYKGQEKLILETKFNKLLEDYKKEASTSFKDLDDLRKKDFTNEEGVQPDTVLSTWKEVLESTSRALRKLAESAENISAIEAEASSSGVLLIGGGQAGQQLVRTMILDALNSIDDPRSSNLLRGIGLSAESLHEVRQIMISLDFNIMNMQPFFHDPTKKDSDQRPFNEWPNTANLELIDDESILNEPKNDAPDQEKTKWKRAKHFCRMTNLFSQTAILAVNLGDEIRKLVQPNAESALAFMWGRKSRVGGQNTVHGGRKIADNLYLIDATMQGKGAGGRSGVGRAAAVRSEKLLMSHLENISRRQGISHVILMHSFAGGSGSGMILPLLQYSRQAFPSAGIWVSSASESKFALNSSPQNTVYITSDILQSHYAGLHMRQQMITKDHWNEYRDEVIEIQSRLVNLIKEADQKPLGGIHIHQMFELKKSIVAQHETRLSNIKDELLRKEGRGAVWDEILDGSEEQNHPLLLIGTTAASARAFFEAGKDVRKSDRRDELWNRLHEASLDPINQVAHSNETTVSEEIQFKYPSSSFRVAASRLGEVHTLLSDDSRTSNQETRHRFDELIRTMNQGSSKFLTEIASHLAQYSSIKSPPELNQAVQDLKKFLEDYAQDLRDLQELVAQINSMVVSSSTNSIDRNIHHISVANPWLGSGLRSMGEQFDEIHGQKYEYFNTLVNDPVRNIIHHLMTEADDSGSRITGDFLDANDVTKATKPVLSAALLEFSRTDSIHPDKTAHDLANGLPENVPEEFTIFSWLLEHDDSPLIVPELGTGEAKESRAFSFGGRALGGKSILKKDVFKKSGLWAAYCNHIATLPQASPPESLREIIPILEPETEAPTGTKELLNRLYQWVWLTPPSVWKFYAHNKEGRDRFDGRTKKWDEESLNKWLERNEIHDYQDQIVTLISSNTATTEDTRDKIGEAILLAHRIHGADHFSMIPTSAIAETWVPMMAEVLIEVLSEEELKNFKPSVHIPSAATRTIDIDYDAFYFNDQEVGDAAKLINEKFDARFAVGVKRGGNFADSSFAVVPSSLVYDALARMKYAVVEQSNAEIPNLYGRISFSDLIIAALPQSLYAIRRDDNSKRTGDFTGEGAKFHDAISDFRKMQSKRKFHHDEQEAIQSLRLTISNPPGSETLDNYDALAKPLLEALLSCLKTNQSDEQQGTAEPETILISDLLIDARGEDAPTDDYVSLLKHLAMTLKSNFDNSTYRDDKLKDHPSDGIDLFRGLVKFIHQYSIIIERLRLQEGALRNHPDFRKEAGVRYRVVGAIDEFRLAHSMVGFTMAFQPQSSSNDDIRHSVHMAIGRIIESSEGSSYTPGFFEDCETSLPWMTIWQSQSLPADIQDALSITANSLLKSGWDAVQETALHPYAFLRNYMWLIINQQSYLEDVFIREAGTILRHIPSQVIKNIFSKPDDLVNQVDETKMYLEAENYRYSMADVAMFSQHKESVMRIALGDGHSTGSITEGLTEDEQNKLAEQKQFMQVIDMLTMLAARTHGSFNSEFPDHHQRIAEVWEGVIQKLKSLPNPPPMMTPDLWDDIKSRAVEYFKERGSLFQYKKFFRPENAMTEERQKLPAPLEWQLREYPEYLSNDIAAGWVGATFDDYTDAIAQWILWGLRNAELPRQQG